VLLCLTQFLAWLQQDRQVMLLTFCDGYRGDVEGESNGQCQVSQSLIIAQSHLFLHCRCIFKFYPNQNRFVSMTCGTARKKYVKFPTTVDFVRVVQRADTIVSKFPLKMVYQSKNICSSTFTRSHTTWSHRHHSTAACLLPWTRMILPIQIDERTNNLSNLS
jgi:hypothetical protein